MAAALTTPVLLVSALAAVGPLTTSAASDTPFARTVIDPTQVPNGHKPKAIGDINGDGLNDIVAYTSGQGLAWYEYPSWTKHRINGGGDGEQAQVADVNGDGALDILVGGVDMTARWYENPRNEGRNPATTTWAEHVIGGRATHDLETGDVNGDGKLDVFTQDGLYIQNTPTSWAQIDNSHFPSRTGNGTSLGDIDRDGHLDMLDASSGQLVWYQNPMSNGQSVNSSWTRRVIGGGYDADSIRVADVNNDGRPDVLLANEYGGGGLSWFQGPADPHNGSWSSHMIDGSVNNVHQSSIMTGDIDGNGTLDVAIAEQEQSSTKRVAVYFNTAGDASTWSQQILSTSGGHNAKLGIIGNDRLPSIVNANHGVYGAPNPVELFRNQLSAPASTTTSSAPQELPIVSEPSTTHRMRDA